MLDLKALDELAAHARAKGVASLTVEAGGWRLAIAFDAPSGQPQPASPAWRATVRAAAFGRLVPRVEAGAHVHHGDIVALLQVGRVYLPVRAPEDGTVTGLLAGAGDLVGYGDAIMELECEPEGPADEQGG